MKTNNVGRMKTKLQQTTAEAAKLSENILGSDVPLKQIKRWLLIIQRMQTLIN